MRSPRPPELLCGRSFNCWPLRIAKAAQLAHSVPATRQLFASAAGSSPVAAGCRNRRPQPPERGADSSGSACKRPTTASASESAWLPFRRMLQPRSSCVGGSAAAQQLAAGWGPQRPSRRARAKELSARLGFGAGTEAGPGAGRGRGAGACTWAGRRLASPRARCRPVAASESRRPGPCRTLPSGPLPPPRRPREPTPGPHQHHRRPLSLGPHCNAAAQECGWDALLILIMKTAAVNGMEWGEWSSSSGSRRMGFVAVAVMSAAGLAHPSSRRRLGRRNGSARRRRRHCVDRLSFMGSRVALLRRHGRGRESSSAGRKEQRSGQASKGRAQCGRRQLTSASLLDFD